MAAPSFVAFGSQASGTTGSVSYPLPAGITDGDTLIAGIESAATGGVTTSTSGWTDVAGSPRAQGSNTLAVNALIDTYASGDGNLVGAGSNNHQTGAIAAFRGVGGVDATSNNSGNGGVITGLGVTTTVDECRVVLVAAWGADIATPQFTNVTNTSLTGVTVHYQAGTTNGNGGGVLIASGVKATAGPVNPWTADLGTTQTWAMLVIALAPAPTSTPPGQSSGAGTWTFAGTGVGARASQSAGSNVFTFTGSGSGSTSRRSSGAGVFAFTGSGSGVTARRSGGSGSWAFIGEGTGVAPSVTARSGSGSGAWAFVGSGSGRRSSRSSGVGTLAFVGNGSGSAPAVGAREGSGSGAWTFTGTGTGKTPRRSLAAGAFQFVGNGTGSTTRSASGSGITDWAGTGSGWTYLEPTEFQGRILGARLHLATATGELDTPTADADLSIPQATGVLT